ncbi:head completion/stabilization protein [Novosphingobium aquae]|uniref:Head completion/stabilization protein n=1 Tax=Novosphingobium aquae TaxID=3133435 RepID=A0ABU8S419_9SPHN
MTDLISTPPAPASPDDSTVTTGAWWPDIDVNAVRAQIRLGGTTIPHDRLVAAIAFAVVEVTQELSPWQTVQADAGKASLAAVAPDRVVNGDPELVVLFLRAVTMNAAAELADRHLDLTATATGTDRAEARADMADDFRCSAVRAIRAITGGTGTMVDLV